MTARVYTLMLHFWQDNIDIEARALLIADWFEVLKDVPAEAVERAISERLKMDDRRKPIAGEIRKRALEMVDRQARPNLGDAPFAALDVPPEELERREQVGEELANVYKFLRPIPKGD